MAGSSRKRDARSISLSPDSSSYDDYDDYDDNDKFTVKKVMRLFDLKPRNKHYYTKLTPQGRIRRQHADLKMAAELRQAAPPAVEAAGPSKIKVIPGDTLDKEEVCPAEARYISEKNAPVDQWERDRYTRQLMLRATPNSTVRKPPPLRPDPEKTFEENLADTVMGQFHSYYGYDEPPPVYPILPPRVRPPVEEPPPKKKAKVKGKGKGKKGRKKKPDPPPLDVTAWRREELPVASTRLQVHKPRPCDVYTPDLSLPPTPPLGVPRPLSPFGWFINDIPMARVEKLVSGRGHYSREDTRDDGGRRKSKRGSSPRYCGSDSNCFDSNIY